MEYPCREPGCDIFPFATETNRNAHEKHGQHTYPKGHPMHEDIRSSIKTARKALADAEAKIHPHIVAGTGARELQVVDVFTKERVVGHIDEQLHVRKEEHGDNLIVMSGMAEGFDKALALRALALNIKLWCAIPNKGYANYYWRDHSLTGMNMINEFNNIIDRAWRVTYVMEDIHGLDNQLYLGGRHSNFLRNDFMVEQATEFLVWDPQSRGTRDCLASIREAGKRYMILALR